MSAMAQIISTNDFNPFTDIAFQKPRLNKAGGKQVGITNSKTSRVLQLSTPLMLTWGVNKRVDESSGRVSYDMSLQFPREGYKTEETTKFLKAIEDMEKFVCESAIKNSKEWFNKAKLTDAQVEVLFNPMLYYSKDKLTGERKEDVEPTFRVKLDCYENFNCEIYDIDSKPLYPSSENPDITPVDLIPKMTNVFCVLKCGGVYFVNGKFGVTWKLEQAKVKPPESLKGKWRGSEVTAEDRKKMEEAIEQAEVDNDEDDSVGVAVEDESDEEDNTPVIKTAAKKAVKEEIDDASVESEPKKKVVKKKVVRRKKTSE